MKKLHEKFACRAKSVRKVTNRLQSQQQHYCEVVVADDRARPRLLIRLCFKSDLQIQVKAYKHFLSRFTRKPCTSNVMVCVILYLVQVSR